MKYIKPTSHNSTKEQIANFEIIKNYLIELPDDRFNYSSSRPSSKGNDGCGCVAYHTFYLFKLSYPPVGYKGIGYQSMLSIAANFLGLDSRVKHFLFMRACHRATKKDAINRLQWLIENKHIDDFDIGDL